MDSFQSQLLVATPQLPDSNFYRSVVLLIHHDSEGAFGVILNRPSNFQLKEVWQMITKQNCEWEAPIYLGGPVESPLVALHEREDVAESEVLDGVFISSEREKLEQLFEGPDCNLKMFSGYSGWGPDQLEAEIETGSWFRSPATVEDVFSDSEELWEKVAGRIGQQIIFQGDHPDLEEFDPTLN